MTTISAIDIARERWPLSMEPGTSAVVLKITTHPAIKDTVIVSVKVDDKHVSDALRDTKSFFRSSQTVDEDDGSFLTVIRASEKADLCTHFNRLQNKYGSEEDDLMYHVCSDVVTTQALQERVRALEEKLRLKNYEIRLKDYEIRLLQQSRARKS
jgi:hypothetical protein